MTKMSFSTLRRLPSTTRKKASWREILLMKCQIHFNKLIVCLTYSVFLLKRGHADAINITITLLYVGHQTASGYVECAQKTWRVVVGYFEKLVVILWRIVEIHVNKAVMITVFVICTQEVSTTDIGPINVFIN